MASNDGTAGGAVAALTAQGMDGIPVSGQDADHAALNRDRQGHPDRLRLEGQPRARQAGAAKSRVELAAGTEMSAVEGAEEWTSPAGTTLWAEFLNPVPITQENLSEVVDAGWIEQDALCQGVEDGPAPCN